MAAKAGITADLEVGGLLSEHRSTGSSAFVGAMRERHHSPPETTKPPIASSMTMTEFVEHKFIPEFVATKRAAGRDYFKAILKHVLRPECVSHLFPSQPCRAKAKLASVPGWPYIDALPVCDVNRDMIQRLTSAALERGYSIQTATHIRNVIRSIFTHAIQTGCYQQPNPAAFVALPKIERKADHSLSLVELRAILGAMVYPERELALLAVLTNMTIVEICGLQWKYVNLFSCSRVLEQEVLPSMSIAVRKQSYRCVLSNVIRSRRRFVPVPRALAARLFDLKQREQFSGPDDFVLVSRNGYPIHPGNSAARRLKSIGASLQIHGLAWSVFNKTRTRLRSELGGSFYEQFNDLVPLPKWNPSPIHKTAFRSAL